MATAKRPGYLRVINGGLSNNPGKAKKVIPVGKEKPMSPEYIGVLERVRRIYESGSDYDRTMVYGRVCMTYDVAFHKKGQVQS